MKLHKKIEGMHEFHLGGVELIVEIVNKFN
jgi:hypothetical protein